MFVLKYKKISVKLKLKKMNHNKDLKKTKIMQKKTKILNNNHLIKEKEEVSKNSQKEID